MANFLRKKQRSVRDVLSELGMSADAIAAAELAGTDELMALDGLVLPNKGKLTIDEVAAKVGTDVEAVRAFWRGLGFVDPVEGERSFNKRDVTILKSVLELAGDGLIEPEVALQVARVVGVSMAQIATAVVDASAQRVGDQREADADRADGDRADGDRADGDRADGDNESVAVRAAELLPFLSDVIDYSFRRHLRAAARRRVAVATAADGVGQVIGFADLVRFTELSLQLDEAQLAHVIGRFDQLVNQIVVRHQGRVVKMIGDAAMFTVVDPVDAALIALELADAVWEDDMLSGLRVGMASGAVLARDGDFYGPVVNLASRLGTIGRAQAINISTEMRNAIAGDQRFVMRSLGTKSLRHIGDVRVYRLRPSTAWASHPSSQPAQQPAQQPLTQEVGTD